MALNYRDLLTRETGLTKELQCLDSLLPEELRDECDGYPQLFENNEDSLFSPDAMFGGGSTNPVNINEILSEHSSAEDKKMFEQYLDSLEINQFIKIQSEIKKNSEKNGNKTLKNLQNSLECTFKPSILKKSNQIAGHLAPSFQRLTSQNPSLKNKTPYQPQDKQLKKTYSKQRIQRLSKPRVMKTEASQTLEIKKQSVEKKHVPRNSNGMDIATRNQIWQDQKNLKIKKLREEEQANKLKKQSGTYVPKTTQYKGERGANISQFGRQGIANYFERVNMAKQKQPKQNSSFIKQNTYSQRRQSLSPYASSKQMSRTPVKDIMNTQPKPRPQQQQRVKYQDAVKQLHKKIMNLNI